MSHGSRSSTAARLVASGIEAGWMTGAAWCVGSRGSDLDSGVSGRVALDPEACPVTAETPFDLASLTKPLATAPLLLLLEQDGVIETAAPAALWIEELSGSPYEDVTVDELATHRSGLPAWRPLAAMAGDLHGYVAAIASEVPAVERGEVLYSDLGYIVLGALLERAAGRGLAELFDERIAAPLALRRCGFADRPSRFSAAAATERGSVYERELAGPAGRDHPWRAVVGRGEVHDSNAHGLGGVAGHAGLFACGHDVARLVREFVSDAPFGLSRSSADRMLRPARGQGSRTFGMVLAAASRAGRGILAPSAPGHTGFTGTSIWIEPERDRFYVLLSNRVHPRVPKRDFQWFRRAFHRVVRRL